MRGRHYLLRLMSASSQDFPALPSGTPAGPSAPFAPFDPDEDEDGGGLNVGRLVDAILRRKWLVIGLTVLGSAAGFGLSRVVKPVYEAQAAIQIPVIVRGGNAPAPMRAAPILEGRGWVELIRSFAVLDEVVRRRQLYIDTNSPADLVALRGLSVTPELVPGDYKLVVREPGRVALTTAEGSTLDEVAVGDSLGRALGIAWVPESLPPGREVAFRLRMPRDAAVRLGNDLGTALPLEGALLRISLRHTNPQEAAATLNAVATRFEEVAILLKREKLTTVTEALREQLANARLELDRAETDLERFKVNTITLPTDRGGPAIASGLQETRDPVRQAFFALRNQREDLVRDRDALERALALPQDSVRTMVVALSTIPAVREARDVQRAIDELTDKRAEARQARVVFAPDRPEVQALDRQVQDLERITIPGAARALSENLAQRIADLDVRIAASSREMQQIPVRVTEENRRERNVTVSQMIYTELQSAYEQARLSELSATPDVRVLDSAVPPTRPVRDQALVVLAGGLLAGLGLGLLLAILLDRFDPRFRYPEQVTRDLGLPILGAVPLLKNGRNGKPSHEDAAILVEAVRSIRMAMLYAHGTAGTFITTVTSPGPGDGKSFVSLQLAKSFATSGRRTLLIDGDNRRGMLHRTLGIARKPGLIDVLEGRAPIEQVLQRASGDGFDVIPCGTRKASAPELLASPQMIQLMVRLRSQYEAIIVDSPPMGAGVDPLVLASLSGTMILVLRTGQTERALAEARLADVSRLPVRVLGAVLNDVKPEGVYRYYSYLPGYRADDEDESSSDEPRLLGTS